VKARRVRRSGFSGWRFFRSKRGIAAIAAVVLILFLFRPGVYRLRTRIATSIGSALGRRVALDNVRLRLLPRPGFDLEGLVIYDDSAFSAEPMIRAQEVSAAIRFRSLLRGRLEIATLSATEPSINLVRNSEGYWNLASLLERNRQIPAAPTGKPASESRPAFPYLEATHARINFKLGDTKKAYALIDADVSLWQDSENSWGARIKAEPVRTDFNLTDTGSLQINATWQRAASLRLTPMQIAVQWRNGQLGQITKLFSGKDRGWRGGLDLTAKISGTPEALLIDSGTVVDGFHRYDIVGSENVRLAATCSGSYNAIARSFADLLCESPVSGGSLRLRGNFAMAAQQPSYDLTLEAEKVPLASVVRFLRQAKQQIPADLTATGLLNGQFHGWRSEPGLHQRARRASPQNPAQTWSGAGVATNVHVLWNAGQEKVNLGNIPLALVADSSGASQANPQTDTGKQQGNSKPAETRLRIGPAAMVINNSDSVDAGGWVSSSGYRFFVRGDMELEEVFNLENVLGLPVARPAAEGATRMDMSVSGTWQGFAAPVTAGTAQLRDARVEMHGLNTPIEIGSANITLTPDSVLMDKINARTGDTHWNGKVSALRHCAATGAVPPVTGGAVPTCTLQFDLTADQLSTRDLQEWFTRHPVKRPWYRILESNSNSEASPAPSPLLALKAHGTLHVGRFGLMKLSATQIATQVDVDRGKITLKSLRAQLLQGTHQGDWLIDVTNRDPAVPPLRYHGSGVLQDISLAQVSTLMSEAWINGSADGKFEMEGSGADFREVMAHSEGKMQFVMRNGSLQHVQFPGSPGPLTVHRFSGELRLKQGAFEVAGGKLDSHDGVYQVGGTASADSGFNIVLTRGDQQSWTLTGTLARPHLVSRPESNRTEAEVNNP
jgi:AsmA protein